MANLNKVFLIGRLTRDPELRYTQSGTAVAEFGLAVNRNFTTSSGEKREETTFVDVIVWRRKAEVVCEYLGKGAPLFVEGRLELDTWETSEGQKRSKLRVVADNFQFLQAGPSGRGEGGGGGPRKPAPPSGPPVEEGPTEGREEEPPFPPEDDLPF
ncbi:MAG: single-stranded DNA-binding protein [Planctomycetes bacterium]|nr:single-stranded DNA-binding protein [Planctomycetota bacterium]